VAVKTKMVGAGLLMGLLGLVWASSAMAISTVPPSPTGYWKVFVSMDYESTGTVTSSMCFPDADQTAPSTLTAEAHETIKVRTARPTLVEMRVAGNGAPVVGDWLFAQSFKFQITNMRASDLEGNLPKGCYDNSDLNYKPRYDCGTLKERTGLFIGPLGGIGRWRGFHLQPQEFPNFESCALTDAQGKLPHPFEVVIEEKPARLVSRKIPKLVYRGKKTFKSGPVKEGDATSSATGSFSYKVTLIKGHPNYR
jgi:hypothetical protein